MPLTATALLADPSNTGANYAACMIPQTPDCEVEVHLQMCCAWEEQSMSSLRADRYFGVMGQDTLHGR